MQQYAFINNNAIVLVSTLDDYTKTLPYEKIEIEKIDFEKYNQGLDIKLENGKVSFYSGERKKLVRKSRWWNSRQQIKNPNS